MVLWLWFTHYVGGRPKIDYKFGYTSEERLPSLLKKSRDRTDQLWRREVKKSFFGDPFFYYDFLKCVKITLLVDLLTFVVLKK